jgi:hypothetical protein
MNTCFKILGGIFLGLSCAVFAHAQTLIPPDGNFSNVPGVGISATDIDVDMSPEFPSAYETVTIRLDSNVVDLNRVHIVWYVNGSRVLEGIGQRSITTKVGDYGSTNDIAARITVDNKVIQKIIDLSPQDITMVYEAVDAYAPPFYPGKKLAAQEGIVRIVALPNFTTHSSTFDPSKGVYIWKRNKKALPGAGGYGKNYITIKHDKLRGSEDVMVRASSLDGSVSGNKTFTFIPASPQIHFYQKIWNQPQFARALDGGFTMNSNITTVTAIPYFFSIAGNIANSLGIDWTINDSPLLVEDTKNPLTLALNHPGSSGQNTIGLTIKNLESMFQEATKTFSVSFLGNNSQE